ncbi:hypothetical protein V3C99_019212 [Haemonchus contortus]|nr:unnamed protein product [Haemonchus contortus]
MKCGPPGRFNIDVHSITVIESVHIRYAHAHALRYFPIASHYDSSEETAAELPVQVKSGLLLRQSCTASTT